MSRTDPSMPVDATDAAVPEYAPGLRDRLRERRVALCATPSPSLAERQVAAPAHGIGVAKVRSIGGSDTDVFDQRGLATVNVGVGMHDTHAVGGWIDTGDLARVRAWLRDALVVGGREHG